MEVKTTNVVPYSNPHKKIELDKQVKKFKSTVVTTHPTKGKLIDIYV